ncbi:MAG: amidohydrolase family protein [Bacteroidales bacterium]|nr:amidohydrolase family protein [Bacteroidales bacterium]
MRLVRALSKKRVFRPVSRLLNNINPFSENDTFDRYVQFVKIGTLASQEKIFNECLKYYPPDTRFAVLPMDMAYMGAGKVQRCYTEQLDELATLTMKYPQLNPFVHIDPRREGFTDIFRKYVEEKGFKGLKIYPPLGYFPDDERFYPLYAYCEKNNLPVIAHCSPRNPVHFKGSKKELLKWIAMSKSPVETKGLTRKELCASFTHPKTGRMC